MEGLSRKVGALELKHGALKRKVGALKFKCKMGALIDQFKTIFKCDMILLKAQDEEL